MKNSSNRRKHAVALFCAACALTSNSIADVIDATWLGGNGSWNDPTKWSGGVVPNNSGSTTFRAIVPSGSVTTSFSASTISLDSLVLDANASVRLMSLSTSAGSQVNGTLTIVSDYTTAAPLTGAGTLDIGLVPSTGTLRGTGSLEIGDGLTVRMKRYYGTVRSGGAGPVINRGRIVGGDPDWTFSPYIIAPIQNLGTIEPSNGALNIGGTFTRADLGNLEWSNGGTLSINGIFLNSGQTLNVDAAHAWGMQGGTIVGGTINVASDTRMTFGSEFTTSATLDDVVINGPIHVQNNPLIVKNGTLGGNLDVLLEQRYIAGAPRITTPAATLTIASTVLVRASQNQLFFVDAAVGDGSSAVVNHGTIVVEPSDFFSPPAQLRVTGSTVFNDGLLSAGSPGAFPPESRGTMRVTGGFTNAGRMVANKYGLFVIDGPLTNTGTIDMGGAMAVNYTSASPMATLVDQLQQGYNGGEWDGPLINSTAAAAMIGTGVGILESANYIAANGTTTFAGQTIDTTTVLLKYTYAGDTDLNGLINFDDYARIDAGFNNGGTDWFHGDFDYNGVVNFDDYALIDLAFNIQDGPLQLVPEPTVALPILATATAFARRRRTI